MSFIRIATLLAIAAGVLPAAASAADRPPTPSGQTGIIAILIGQVKSEPFTPPIGTDKGSIVAVPRG